MARPVLCAALGALLSMGSATASERVSFDSLDADLTAGKPTRIQAALYMPRGRGPFAAVVLLHGCGGLYRWKGRHVGQMVPRNAAWAERLAAQGFVVVLPDSFGPRGVHESCTVKDRPVDSSRERPCDAYGALKWLQQQPDVIGDRVAVMGWSNGGGTVLHTIAVNELPSRVAWPKDGFRAAVAFYPGCSDPQTSATGRRWRASVPLLIMQGEADDWTPAEPCRRLAAAARAGRAGRVRKLCGRVPRLRCAGRQGSYPERAGACADGDGACGDRCEGAGGGAGAGSEVSAGQAGTLMRLRSAGTTWLRSLRFGCG